MDKTLNIALVAHDNMKRDLAEWVDWNWAVLLKHHLVCTGTTGKMVERTLRDRRKELHYTQTYLSEFTGFSVSFISDLERGKPTVELEKTLKIINILGLDILIEKRG